MRVAVRPDMFLVLTEPRPLEAHLPRAVGQQGAES